MRRLRIGFTLLVTMFSFVPRLSAAPDKDGRKRAIVVVYDGWATPSSLRITGRVLEDQNEALPTKKDSASANLWENLKALESDEIPGANVSVAVGDRVFAATADRDGVFEVVAKNLPAEERLKVGVLPVVVTLTSPETFKGVGNGKLYVHPDIETTGVISDIDDTVVRTYVPDKARMVKEVLLKNATQLEPVTGAATNYQQAVKAGVYAFFYVSGSPQNLYPRLRKLLDDNGFPGGPIVLKNLGDDKLFAQDDYKLNRIEKLLAAFPQMRFVCVGDSGERDPEIYAAIRQKHPDRVVAIVIRKAPGSKLLAPERFKDMITVDDAYAAGLLNVRIVHGKGTGALRKAIWETLKTDNRVQSVAMAHPDFGGAGATELVLRQ